MKLLEIENFNVYYVNKKQSNHAVKNVNLTFEENTTYGIIGESGSGKTTLMMGALQLLSTDYTRKEGSVRLLDNDLNTMPPGQLNRLRWEEIAVVFQNSMNTLSPVHRIRDQIVDIYRAHRPKTSEETIKNELLKIFEVLNLKESVYHAYPHELSGGMMQRVSIALSLMFNPRLIVLDEATTALDVITQKKILSELKTLDDLYANTKIYVTHDLSVIKQTCEKVIVMFEGEVVEKGNIEDVFERPQHPYTQKMMHNYWQLNPR